MLHSQLPKSSTRLLILINCAVYVLMISSRVETQEEYLLWGANYGPLVFQGEWWRLLTSVFVHFHILHIFMNMLALWQLGPVVEWVIGSGKMLTLFLLSGIGGSVASVYWNEPILSGGASGAIYGLLGAFIAFLMQRRIVSRVPNYKPLKGALNILALNVAISLLPGIDLAAHMGGLVLGFFIALYTPSSRAL